MDWLDLSSTLGLIATAVLTFNILLGMLLSTAYRRSPLWRQLPAWLKPVSLDGLHNWTAYVALALALAHPLLLLPDQATKFHLGDILFPVNAPHQPAWVILGSLSLYALITVVITTQKRIKRRMGFRAWKNIHLVSYGTALLFIVHGVVMDPQLKDKPIDWLDAEKVLSEICGLVLILATIIRYWYHLKRPKLRRVVPVLLLCIGSAASAQQFESSLFRQLHFRFIGPDGNRAIAVAGVPGDRNTGWMGRTDTGCNMW